MTRCQITVADAVVVVFRATTRSRSGFRGDPSVPTRTSVGRPRPSNSVSVIVPTAFCVQKSAARRIVASRIALSSVVYGLSRPSGSGNLLRLNGASGKVEPSLGNGWHRAAGHRSVDGNRTIAGVREHLLGRPGRGRRDDRRLQKPIHVLDVRDVVVAVISRDRPAQRQVWTGTSVSEMVLLHHRQ